MGGHLTRAAAQRQEHIDSIRGFLQYQQNQALTLLKVILMYKSAHPLGLDLPTLVQILGQHNRLRIFPNVGAAINTLGTLGLLELRPNGTVDVTGLGYDYVLDSHKR